MSAKYEVLETYAGITDAQLSRAKDDGDISWSETQALRDEALHIKLHIAELQKGSPFAAMDLAKDAKAAMDGQGKRGEFVNCIREALWDQREALWDQARSELWDQARSEIKTGDYGRAEPPPSVQALRVIESCREVIESYREEKRAKNHALFDKVLKL